MIARVEVLAGGFPGEEAAVFDLCEQFACLPLTKETADHASDLRRANGWKLPDAFHAALARDHGFLLVTRNSKDFSGGKHPFALIP